MAVQLYKTVLIMFQLLLMAGFETKTCSLLKHNCNSLSKGIQ